MSSSPDKSQRKTWILVVIGVIVVAFIGVSVFPLLNNSGNPQQASNTSPSPTATQQESQEDLASQARGYRF